MGHGSQHSRIRWRVTSATAWATYQAHRGYSATISVSGGVYTLAVTGTGSYSSTWPTLKNAKNDFRKYLLDKSG